MIGQLIPGTVINREGLIALRLYEQVERWRDEGKMKVHLTGRTLYFETDPIIAEIKKCKDRRRPREAGKLTKPASRKIDLHSR